MKKLVLIVLAAASTIALADGQISTSAKNASLISTSNNSTEMGFDYSSINNGTAFATVAVIHEFESGFGIGARGLLPLQFNNQATAYIGQLLARFTFINDTNQMYMEGTLGEGLFNDIAGTTYFGMIGLDYGYSRMLTKELSVGAHIGADFASARVNQGLIDSGSSTLYSKIGITGGYYF